MQVRWDEWGVPHIYAGNAEDLFFAQGYTQAQDRWWQMEWWRRSREGRLAEVLGAAAVERDRQARLLKFRGPITEAEWTSYHPEGRRIFANTLKYIQITTSANFGNMISMALATPLLPFLQNHTSVLVGQSGMGKSTLINALLPDAQATTQEISTALDSGKHTTTHARLYHLNPSSHLIDCPGVQVFGLHHLTLGQIEEGFIEFAAYRGQCRFRDCRHLHEPGCVLIEAVEKREIDARRLRLFQAISS